jgi:hypothetical protein
MSTHIDGRVGTSFEGLDVVPRHLEPSGVREAIKPSRAGRGSTLVGTETDYESQRSAMTMRLVGAMTH